MIYMRNKHAGRKEYNGYSIPNKRNFIRKGILLLAIIFPVGITGVLLFHWTSIIHANHVDSESKVVDEQNCNESEAQLRQKEEGYNLTVDEEKKDNIEKETTQYMNLLGDLVQNLTGIDYKGSYGNEGSLSEEQLKNLLSSFKKEQHPVYVKGMTINMENAKEAENFLNQSANGEEGNVVIYELHKNIGLSRKEFIYDGKDMYLLATDAVWGDSDHPIYLNTTYTRMKQWSYTPKGWFCYDLCVPDGSQVTEVVEGKSMIRIKPQRQDYLDFAEKYLMPIKYQGNNLFTTNWDASHLEVIDYTGMYDAAYELINQTPFQIDAKAVRILEQDFENTIMQILPVTREQLKSYAMYDSSDHCYQWKALGCGNYFPTSFGNTIPEITNIEEQADGTEIVTVDAVCERSAEDAIITHKLTVRMDENGNIHFLKNVVQGDGLSRVPYYYYRTVSME